MTKEVARWIADHLPHAIVYFAVVRVWARVTTEPPWSSEESVALTVSDALTRWHVLHSRPNH